MIFRPVISVLFMAAVSMTLSVAGKAEEWSLAEVVPRLMIFPEIEVGDRILKEVPVPFFEPASKEKSISDGLWKSIQRANADGKQDPYTAPFTQVINQLLLTRGEGVEGEYFIITLKQLDIISITTAAKSRTVPPFYQEILRPKLEPLYFHSTSVAQELLKLARSLSKLETTEKASRDKASPQKSGLKPPPKQ
jgi:hypothetical protein